MFIAKYYVLRLRNATCTADDRGNGGGGEARKKPKNRKRRHVFLLHLKELTTNPSNRQNACFTPWNHTPYIGIRTLENTPVMQSRVEGRKKKKEVEWIRQVSTVPSLNGL